MAKLIFGMMQSLDGYVAGVPGGPELPPPGADLHRYFNDQVHGLAGMLYGRLMYEVMRYWDDDKSEWGEIEVSGPNLASSLSAPGIIDEYHLYFRPFVLGGGKPYFAAVRPQLRLVETLPVGADALRLTYVPV